MKNSVKSGYGIEIYRDNSEYKGYFLKGKKEGIGSQKRDDSSFYKGEWKDSKFHDYGIYQFADGSEYRQHLFRIFLEAWKLLKKYKASKFLCMEAYIKNGIFIKI